MTRDYGTRDDLMSRVSKSRVPRQNNNHYEKKYYHYKCNCPII